MTSAAVVETAVASTACIVADAAGRYLFPGIAEGIYTVGAQAEGFKPGWAFGGQPVGLGRSEARQGVDIVLAHGGVALSGHVVDATGGPVPGALVGASVAGQRAAVSLSGRDGRFTSWVEPGMVDVTAGAPGYASARATHIAPSRDLVLTLTPASSIEGVVVADADGGAMYGLDVHAAPVARRTPASEQPSGKSGADGAFAIHDLAPGGYTLVAEGDGWRGQVVEPVRVGIADVARVRVTVSRAATVTGQVTLSEGGGPCPGGTVKLGARGPGSIYDPPGADDDAGLALSNDQVPALVSTIAPDGTVRFPATPPALYHVSVQCLRHLLLGGPTLLRVEQRNIGDLKWEVGPGAKLVVHVVDEGQRPMSGARFRVSWPRRAGSSAVAAVSGTADSEGRGEVVDGLYPGTYTVAPDAGYDGQPVMIELTEGTALAEGTLRLSGQSSIEVTVKDTDGDPIDGVRVSVRAARAPSHSPPSPAGSGMPGAASTPPNAAVFFAHGVIQATPLGNGQFHVGPVAAGRYEIEVRDGLNGDPPPDPSKLVDVQKGRSEATIVLDRSGRILGRVVEDSGQPMADVWVQASCRAPQAGPFGQRSIAGAGGPRVLTGPEGRFILRGISRGAVCSLRAEATDGSVSTLPDVHTDDDVVVTFGTPGAIGGIAQSEDGRAIDHFTIWMMNQQSGVSQSQTIAPIGGRWSIARVTPGHWTLHAVGAGESAEQQLDLAPGQTMNELLLSFRGGTSPSSAR